MQNNNQQNQSQPIQKTPNKTVDNAKNMIGKIPFLNLPDLPLISTTQDELPIADITDDLVLFKDGGAALVMETTSLNFGLLSEKEQQAVVYSYAALLNSLSFSIQILVRSQRKDISNYLTYLAEAANKISNPKLQVVMNSYRTFIAEIVKKKNVLGKRFFIVVPFSPLELGAKQSFSTVTKRGPLPFPKSYILKKAQVALYPKRDHLTRQAGRLSIKLTQLNTNQLIELFYEFYNPTPPAITDKGIK
ncbi:MAG TPA: hypothetical protein VG895_04550 [Patescibacteria group bacterium]|nr:hypothetical protein [Patescibacteria group bacterium]